MTSDRLVVAAAGLLVVAGPLLLGAVGLIRGDRAVATDVRASAPSWNWRLTTMSALADTLAFNLTFFVQELALVVSKACTPGLRPTLFHNDHHWDGDNPLAGLLQGTGVVATLITGSVCAVLLRRGRQRSTTVRLFLFWMTYCGLFMALPQIVVGAVSPASDVGMAMVSLGLAPATKAAAALAALVAIPLVALRLRHPLLAFADVVDSASARTRFVFATATLPTLTALPLIVAFRVPREWTEVVLVPAVVGLIGVAWMQAGAWCLDRDGPVGSRSTVMGSIARQLGAVVLLLLTFQLVLRPGIRFF